MCSILALELKSCSWNETKDVDFTEISFFSFVFELFGHPENVKLLRYKFRVPIAMPKRNFWFIRHLPDKQRTLLIGLGKRLAHKRNTIIQFLMVAKLFIGTPKCKTKFF